MTRIITGVKIHDMNCGLKIYRKEVIKTIKLYGELHRYIPAIAQWDGFHVAEIPVNHRPRKYGKSKYGVSRFVKGSLDLITVFVLSRYTKRPLHLFGVFGLIFLFSGVAITAYLIILRMLKAIWLSNRPLIYIGILLILLGSQFLSIGILGELIARSQAKDHTYSIRRSLGV